MFNKILKLKLKIISRMIIKKYQPEIIGITGSVGKTTTRELVYTVLKDKFEVRRSLKNYNNEIGLPLTIIGAESPGSSIVGWMKVMLVGMKLILSDDENYPKILILEMGIDRPGDMEHLMSIVKPKIGIVTTIGQSHIEYFGTEAKIQNEKGILIENVKKEGWSILNFDNDKTKKLVGKSMAKVKTFGFKPGADIGAQDINFKDGEVDGVYGINFKLRYNGAFMPISLPGVICKNSIYAALAAAAVGVIYDMNLVEISAALLKLKPYKKGRMNILEGIENSILIDDTYNSSPQSIVPAIGSINSISTFKNKRKVAILGDMLELGSYNDKGHKLVGEELAKGGFSVIIGVGEEMKKAIKVAIKKGVKVEDTHSFNNSIEASEFFEKNIKNQDVVFIKGSQGMRMEKVVKALMKEPEKASDLLVRQDKEWDQ